VEKIEEKLLQIQAKLDKCFQKINSEKAATISLIEKKQLLCSLGSQMGMFKAF
jgi:hypothetical protein